MQFLSSKRKRLRWLNAKTVFCSQRAKNTAIKRNLLRLYARNNRSYNIFLPTCSMGFCIKDSVLGDNKTISLLNQLMLYTCNLTRDNDNQSMAWGSISKSNLFYYLTFHVKSGILLWIVEDVVIGQKPLLSVGAGRVVLTVARLTGGARAGAGLGSPGVPVVPLSFPDIAPDGPTVVWRSVTRPAGVFGVNIHNLNFK